MANEISIKETVEYRQLHAATVAGYEEDSLETIGAELGRSVKRGLARELLGWQAAPKKGLSAVEKAATLGAVFHPIARANGVNKGRGKGTADATATA